MEIFVAKIYKNVKLTFIYLECLDICLVVIIENEGSSQVQILDEAVGIH